MTVVGGILAGGRSRRMGRPKHGIRLRDGWTMIERVETALVPLCTEIVVVGTCDALPGRPRIADRRHDVGPLAGIEALLHSARGDRYLVVPCDLPLVTAALLRRLLDGGPGSMVVFQVEHEARPRALPALLDASLADTVTALLEQDTRAVHALIALAEATVVEIDVEAAVGLSNVNTPADLARLGG